MLFSVAFRSSTSSPLKIRNQTMTIAVHRPGNDDRRFFACFLVAWISTKYVWWAAIIQAPTAITMQPIVCLFLRTEVVCGKQRPRKQLI
jgi:hypothetical protein